MDRKDLKEYALIALIITLVFFIIVLLSGEIIHVDYYRDVNEKVSDIRLDFQDIELALFLGNMDDSVSCQYYSKKLENVDETLKEIKPTVLKLERDMKTNLEEYKELKRKFIAIRLKYWLVSELMKSECGANYTTVLYFYKTEERCKECTRQGHVLSYLENKHDYFEVVPVDKDEDLILIRALREAYNITKVPTLLIDRKVVMRGLTSKEEIYNYTCKKYNNSKEICDRY